jgi:hypothetical protein
VYRPPVYRTVDSPSSHLQKLKAKALQCVSHSGATADELDDLLFLVSEERKRVAIQHRYREGLKYNAAVEHIEHARFLLKRGEVQRAGVAAFRQAQSEHAGEVDGFDHQTRLLERELMQRQREQRDAIAAAHAGEMDELDRRWKSIAKRRLYNRATNHLTN